MEQWSWQLGWHESEASRVQGGYCQERWKQDIVAGAGSWGSNDNMISNPSLANGRPERSGTGMICPLRPFSTVYLIMHDFLIKSLLSKRLIKSEFHPPKKQGNCFSPGLVGSTSWSWDLAWEGSRFSTDSQSESSYCLLRDWACCGLGRYGIEGDVRDADISCCLAHRIQCSARFPMWNGSVLSPKVEGSHESCNLLITGRMISCFSSSLFQYKWNVRICFPGRTQLVHFPSSCWKKITRNPFHFRVF